jgi:GxxExxY protein
MAELLYSALTGDLLGAYYAVYNGTGRTYPEFIYENGWVKVIGQRQISYRRQPEYQIVYKDHLAGVQRLDILIVDEKVVIECKVVPCLGGIHKAQAFSYMKTAGARVGLLLNFGGTEPEFERLYFDPERQTEYEPAFRPSDELSEGLLHPDVTGEVLGTAIVCTISRIGCAIKVSVSVW